MLMTQGRFLQFHLSIYCSVALCNRVIKDRGSYGGPFYLFFRFLSPTYVLQAAGVCVKLL